MKKFKILAIFKGGMRIFFVDPHDWITKMLFSLIFDWKSTVCSKELRRDPVTLSILKCKVGAFGANFFFNFAFFSVKIHWIWTFWWQNDSISVREWSIVIRRKLPGAFYALSYCRSRSIFGYFIECFLIFSVFAVFVSVFFCDVAIFYFNAANIVLFRKCFVYRHSCSGEVRSMRVNPWPLLIRRK